jgi:hypothetical protein
LKSRVNGIIDEIKSDKTRYKDLIHLTKPIWKFLIRVKRY